MESSPFYPSKEHEEDRRKGNKERPSYQSNASVEQPHHAGFVDPRRSESSPPPIVPLEGIIRIRQPDEEAAAARFQYMQQMEQQAAGDAEDDDSSSKKGKRSKDQYVAPPEEPSATPAEEYTPAPIELSVLPVATSEESPAATDTSENEEPSDAEIASLEAEADQEQSFVQEEPQAQQPAMPAYEREDGLHYAVPVAAEAEQPLTSVPTEQPPQPHAQQWHATPPVPVQVELYQGQSSPDAQPFVEATASPAPEADQAQPSYHFESQDEQLPQQASEQPQWATDHAQVFAPQEGHNPFYANQATRRYEEPAPVAAPPMPPYMGGPRPPFGPYEYPGSNNGAQPPVRPELYDTPGSPSARLERLIPAHSYDHRHAGIGLALLGAAGVHVLSKGRDRQLETRIDATQHQFERVQEQQRWAQHDLLSGQQVIRAEQQQAQRLAQESYRRFAEAYPAQSQPTAPSLAEAPAPVYTPPVEQLPQPYVLQPIQPHPERPPQPIYTVAGVPVATANSGPRPESMPFANSSSARLEQRPNAAGMTRPQPTEQHPISQQEEAAQEQTQGHTVNLRPGEHLRQSSWHTYVEKNGQVVTDAIEYGRGFQQEQQERFHYGQNDTAAPAAQQTYDMYGAVNPSLPSGMTTPSLPAGTPTHADAQHQLTSHASHKNQITSNLTNPWFWLMLALLFAAFFIAATV